MSVYTYWAIPDWNGDLPSFDFLRTPSESLETWKRFGVEGAQIETSYAAGAAGIGLYVLGRVAAHVRRWAFARDDRWPSWRRQDVVRVVMGVGRAGVPERPVPWVRMGSPRSAEG
jgi:hypothetical protein